MEAREIIDNYFQETTMEIDTVAKPISRKDILTALNRNEDGDATLFRDLYEKKFVYDHSGNRWYKWAGHHWEEDVIDNVTAAVEGVIQLYSEEADRQSEERINAERSGNKSKATLCR